MKDSGKYPVPESKTKLSKPKTRRSAINRFLGRIQSANIFYLISGVFQILVGLIVTAVSILNLVQPLWISALLSLLGCIVTMLGSYQVYDIWKNSRSVEGLARDAIERAIESRN